MPNIIMSKLGNQLDGSLKKKAYAFLEKLTTDDTAVGLHIEPIKNAVDPRVRTGRVDDNFRAVLFRLQGTDEPTYVFHGIWKHDEAIAVAMKTTLTVNPVKGIAEIKVVEPTGGHLTPPAPVTPVTQPPLLVAKGVTEAELVDELGVDPDLAAAAMAATDDDALLALAARAVEWQGLAILDLAAGLSLAEVKERLSLDEPVERHGDETEDEAILRGLEHAAAKLTFTYIEDDEALRRAIEEGDFGAWRVFLHPEQRRYVTGSWNGPFRLSGGAGTGKTVVVLHRARELARKNPRARIVVTTFTTNLAEAMKRDLRRLDPSLPFVDEVNRPGILVIGVDRLVSQVLKHAGSDADRAASRALGEGFRAWPVRPGNERWREVLELHDSALPANLRSDSFFQAEYTSVVLPNLVTHRDAYLKVRRPGSGVALDRAKRNAVWQVVEAYRRRGAVEGTLDFDEAAMVAAVHLHQLRETRSATLADHVLVDEAQDLTPPRFHFLRALAGEKHRDDLFIAEDSHQRIYGRKVVLSRYGIEIVGRSRRLTLNYRTTAQNLRFALGILKPGEYVDVEEQPESTLGYRSARSGPTPQVHPCASLAEEYDNAAATVRRWLEAGVVPETVAILARDGYQRDKVAVALEERGVPVRAIDREAIRPGHPVVMTMHRAKGTEFSRVLLFGVSEGSIPAALHSEKYSENAWDDALLRERSLLYVAATRARDELVVSWSGAQSQFLASVLECRAE